MKNWTPIICAFALAGFACAALMHAATTNLFEPDYPAAVALPAPSEATVLAEINSQRVLLDRALQEITVADRTPEELRASFTNYWNQRLCLDLSALNAWERSEVELSIKLAHLTRISELSEELKAQPRTWELQFVANELVRGAQATAE